MTAVTKKEYFAYDFTNVHWHVANNDGTKEKGTLLGEFSQFEGETTTKTIVRNVEGNTAEQVSKPSFAEGKIKGHFLVSTLRKLFGFTTDGLKAGVWAYGSSSQTANFALTADERDMYENKHLIAFPNMAVTGGFSWSLENGSEEVAEVEIPVKAMLDADKQLRYDMFGEEVEDQSLATKWHTDFSTELVKEPTQTP